MSRPATRRAASLGRLLTNGFVAFSLWVLSRALMALLWSNRETFIDHDVRYYFWQLDSDGVSGALVEYPTPIAVFLDLIRITAGRTENAYVIAFVLIMVILTELSRSGCGGRTARRRVPTGVPTRGASAR